MGIYLSAPDTRKNSVEGQGNGVKWGASSMQGWRLNMEDAHISEATFDKNTSLFAVFDGHGGSEVAKYCGMYFGTELKANQNYLKGNYEESLRETFLKMDAKLLSPEGSCEAKRLKSDQDGADSFAGCTANVVLIVGKDIYCANAGDSRCIAWGNKKTNWLSEDHKPDNELEEARISKAGGFVHEGRVNGNLNLSRALGDLEYKKNASLKPQEQLISPMPDVKKHTYGPSDQFLVMGCDGIWEILSVEDICVLAEAGLKSGKKPAEVAEEIMDKGLAPDTSNGVGCDNMSCIVIELNK